MRKHIRSLPSTGLRVRSVYGGRVIQHFSHPPTKDLLAEAEQQERDDMDIAVLSDLWPRAVEFLRRDLAAVREAIQDAIAAGGEHGWYAPYHFGWGMAVRNKLRDAGFGEKEFGVGNLDNIYVKLVEDAMKEAA